MKADLHYHGPIGIHSPWLKLQGYQGKNLALLVFDAAEKRDIDLLAITSEQFVIPKHSEHDRFNYLFDEARRLSPFSYKTDKLGNRDIAFVIERESDGRRLTVLNGQTVIIANKDGVRLDHLVIGSNQVTNLMNLKDTLSCCRDQGLIQIAEHPYCKGHFGIGEELLEEYLGFYDAIEGHNSQMILPEFLSRLPKVGKYNQGVNKKAQEFAERHDLSWIATSDAHRIKDLGISYVEFGNSINSSNEEEILKQLKIKIMLNLFTKKCRYENPIGWIKWVSQFQYGLRKIE